MTESIDQPQTSEPHDAVIAEALAVIDQALGRVSDREVVSSVEVADLLLDVRTLLRQCRPNRSEHVHGGAAPSPYRSRRCSLGTSERAPSSACCRRGEHYRVARAARHDPRRRPGPLALRASPGFPSTGWPNTPGSSTTRRSSTVWSSGTVRSWTHIHRFGADGREKRPQGHGRVRGLGRPARRPSSCVVTFCGCSPSASAHANRSRPPGGIRRGAPLRSPSRSERADRERARALPHHGGAPGRFARAGRPPARARSAGIRPGRARRRATRRR